MPNIFLEESEIKLLNMSISHCLETCEDKAEGQCKDCAALKAIQSKLLTA